MKHFDINWQHFLTLLPKWHALDIPARRCFLTQIRSKATVGAELLDSSAAPLLKSGFLLPSATFPDKVKPNPAFDSFRRVMQIMCRFPLFDLENPQMLFRQYAREHFTNRQRQSLFSRSIDATTSVEWVKDFLALDAKELANWEDRYSDQRSRAYRFLTSNAVRTAQQVLQKLIQHNGPIEFSRLQETFPKIPSLTWYTVIPACLRYMLLFAALRQSDLEPMLGVWPPIVKRLNRPTPPTPQPVEPAETFQADLLVQDMTTILSLCHASPMRMRANDYQLFSKARTLIKDHLVSLPDWIQSLKYYPLTGRIDLALTMLYDLKFVSTKGKQGKDYRMDVSKKGLDWLALTAAQRVQYIFDLLAEYGGHLTSHGRGQFDWLPGINTYWLKKKERGRVKAILEQAFQQFAADEFYDLEGFLTYQSIQVNPLKEGDAGENLKRMFVYWSYYRASEAQIEQKWKEFLFNYAIHRLAALGGIKLGATSDRKVCLALTPWGRYHLGLTDQFEMPAEEAQDLFVQPNFEVVFLGPCAAAEAEIGRFAERIGKGMGTLFKITKASILQAAAAGLTAEQVLSTLEKVSTKPIPPNVSREVTGWFASCRQIRIKSSILIHCPDEETAMKIQSLGRRDVTSLTSNILEISSAQAKKTLIGKLRKQGIFTIPAKA